MKRLLDRMLARWYVPVESYADAVSIAAKIATPEPEHEYIQLKPGCYWPVPTTETQTVRGMRCS